WYLRLVAAGKVAFMTLTPVCMVPVPGWPGIEQGQPTLRDSPHPGIRDTGPSRCLPPTVDIACLANLEVRRKRCSNDGRARAPFSGRAERGYPPLLADRVLIVAQVALTLGVIGRRI